MLSAAFTTISAKKSWKKICSGFFSAYSGTTATVIFK